MIDGLHFGEHTCVVALGIDIDGVKHPLSLVEGSTENTTLVTDLIVGLRERGLDVTRPSRRCSTVEGAAPGFWIVRPPVIAAANSTRNVRSSPGEALPSSPRGCGGLPCRLRAGRRGRAGALAAELDTHPGAAASLREGMDETLTVLRLGVSPTLARTLRSTNADRVMISICRDARSNVKRWRDGQMALRWCAAGMVEAGKQFRRVNGHLHLRSLRDTLEASHRNRRYHRSQ